MHPDDTIVALASAPGGAYRGIVRLSGPQAVDCVSRVFLPDDAIDWRAERRARVWPGQLAAAPPVGRLPGDLYLWPTSRSYTRQPSAEFHTIGSPPLLEAAVRTFVAAGARPAEPGEFTLRAFLAGRLDLTQAEAVLGVIAARTRTELDVALAQLAGGLSGPLSQLRDRLLDLLAELEAGLDFAEEDLEFVSRAELDRQLAAAERVVAELHAQMATRSVPSGEPRVVLRGAPNVGKSSLFNALTGAAALVSEQAGTTRDYVTSRFVLAGLSCWLVDTAGLDDAAADAISQAAQQMSARQQEQADLELFCLDATRPPTKRERLELLTAPRGARRLVLTKSDAAAESCGQTTWPSALATSSRTGAGLAALRSAIRDELAGRESRVVASTAQRCEDSVRRAGDAVTRARALAARGRDDELVAAELRLALDELGRVVGAVYTDDVLDRIFSRFCIGK